MKTILDYGAVLYNSLDKAIQGGNPANEAIQKMLDDIQVAVLPPYGFFYMDDTVFNWYENSSIISLGQGNKAVKLVTDKPISMFLVVNNFAQISGFTAYYVGDKITKECSVIRLGGDKRNIGGVHFKHPNPKHWRPNRTHGVGHNFDFDIRGDKKYYISALTNKAIKNPDFIENGGCHGVWVDYDNETEHEYSSLHFTKIRGDWDTVNTGIKITKRKESKQAMNTLDVNVTIRGFRMACDIHGTLNRSKIIIYGNHSPTLNFSDDKLNRDTEEWKVASFYIEGSALNCGIFNYDRNPLSKYGMGRNKIKGQYHVKGLNLVFPLLVGGKGSKSGNDIHIDADLNDSTLRQGTIINSISGIKIE